jgi:hypothetical protein
MIAAGSFFKWLFLGRTLHGEGSRFVASPVVYVAGAAGLAGLAYLLLGGLDHDRATALQKASPPGVDCGTLIRGIPIATLREAVASAVTAPHEGAAVAAYLDTHNYPNVAACVRRDPVWLRLIKVLVGDVTVTTIAPPVTPPNAPPPSVPHPTREPGCAPIEPMHVSYPDTDMTFADIARAITGDARRANEIQTLNEPLAGKVFYRYLVRQPMIGVDGSKTPFLSTVDSDHARSAVYPFTDFATDVTLLNQGFIHSPGGVANVAMSETPAWWAAIESVTFEGVYVRADATLLMPDAWNAFFAFEGEDEHGDHYVVTSPGETHSPCAV